MAVFFVQILGGIIVHHLRDLTAVFENDNQSWATRFKWFLLSIKRVIEQIQLAGATVLPIQKVAQIERIYDQLVASALLANPPPPGGWPKGKRGRAKKT